MFCAGPAAGGVETVRPTPRLEFVYADNRSERRDRRGGYHARRSRARRRRVAPCRGGRYDLIFDVDGRLLRIQCKWGCRHGDVIVIRCYSSRRSAEGLCRSVYSREEVDAFAAYRDDVRRCYFLPFDAVPARGSVQLRLTRPLNNQNRRALGRSVRVRRYTEARQGAIAQLGER